MCGRFSFFIETSTAEERFEATAVRPLSPRYNIAPSNDIPTITNETSESIDQQRWGLLPHWVDEPDGSPQPINARAESIDTKPYFRDAFEKRRCLVLADGFYEWKADGRYKTPYRITIDGGEPFAMAGVWETWGENGSEKQTVAIVTTEANDVVGEIHDRMPVIFERNEERRWIDEEDPDERKALLDPIAAGVTDAYEISTRVNNPAHDDPAAIERIGGEQSGLGEFT